MFVPGTVLAIETDLSIMMKRSIGTASASLETPVHDVELSPPWPAASKGKPSQASVGSAPVPPLLVELPEPPLLVELPEPPLLVELPEPPLLVELPEPPAALPLPPLVPVLPPVALEPPEPAPSSPELPLQASATNPAQAKVAKSSGNDRCGRGMVTFLETVQRTVGQP
jgi:hypothetical protein